jgi:hypothetical protein
VNVAGGGADTQARNFTRAISRLIPRSATTCRRRPAAVTAAVLELI